ncbi:hypothetical protein FC18_GL001902 [Lacticaseibacillus sharpeae JCM 1186 = DSM 20505]|uniref:Uncharacterized protein n=2 Tax=Lacticaseibacillus sharpeae TaxID=1626 RepID=A0A0R1ZVL7_9LACO|nr:hypothetical protein FC18_GL001902 [Lacticaseibacillus sharpeae JCM 1186 = DSM 20505]
MATLEIIILLDINNPEAKRKHRTHITLVLTTSNCVYLYPKGVQETMADIAETTNHKTMQLRRLFTSQIAKETLALSHMPTLARRCSLQHFFVATTNDRRRCRVWFNLVYLQHIRIVETKHGANQVSMHFTSGRKTADYCGNFTGRLTDLRQTIHLLQASEYAWHTTPLAHTLITKIGCKLSHTTENPRKKDAADLLVHDSIAYELVNNPLVPGIICDAETFLEQAKKEFALHVELLRHNDQFLGKEALVRIDKYQRGSFASPEQVGEDFAESYDF